MLVAKRDSFELGTHDRPLPHTGAASTSSHFTRTMTALQMIGALLAIPVGIGSAYSMYQVNFSPEATCKSLRVNIVRMLDKNVDAGTRHMLVRRDVEAFENACGTVDPDATTAFKALLTADKAAPVASAAVPPAESQWQAVERKTEPPLRSKPQAARAAANAPVQHEALLSDAAWVAAVRTALAHRDSDKKPAARTTAAASMEPALAPRTLGVLPVSPAQPEPHLTAPALPPAASVAALPAPQVDPDHPVPPAAIPEAVTGADAYPRSRFGALVEDIPFVGKMLADRVSR